MKSLTIKALKFVVRVAIFSVLFWYGSNAVNNPGNLDKAIIGMTVLGVTYGISRPLFGMVSEITGGIMVIAEFLNRHLLEPQKQRLLEEGRKEGHKEGIEVGRARERAEAKDRLNEARARLRALGLDPDEIIPDNTLQETDDER